MEASTYCFGLNEEASSLKHIYWGPRTASAVAVEMARTQVPLKRPFAASEGAIREEQELEEARGFIAIYKRARSVIQNGLLYRLLSPRTGSVAATQYVARDGSEMVLFAWGHSQQFEHTQVTLSLPGLEEEAGYTDVVSGATYHGAYLAHHGLPVSLVGDFDSHMIHLVREVPAQ